MSPEFGSTCAIFPIDAETLRYLAFSGPPEGAHRRSSRPTPRSRASGTTRHAEEPTFSDTVELDLGDVVPSLAGPEAPAGPRRRCTAPRTRFRAALAELLGDDAEQEVADGHDEAIAETLPGLRPAGQRRARPRAPTRTSRRRRPPSPPAPSIAEHSDTAVEVTLDGETFKLDHGHVVIAAITSCTNTSNPSVMLGAGLLARNARGARADAPAVGQDLAGAGLEGRHRVPRPRRADRAARGARLQPRRLRLHDVHRQLRARCPTRSRAAVNEARPRGRARCSAATATSRAASTPT